MNIVVIGHKQHGKGTFADIAQARFGLTQNGTSRFAADFMFERMKKTYPYRTVEECHGDRDNHRPTWYQGLADYNTPNPYQLIQDILSTHDIAEGLRHRDEYTPLRASGLVDVFIWIDASERKPLESKDSMTLTRQDADIIIDNNGTEAEFEARVVAFLSMLKR
jgi:hypothetical protein